MLLPDQQLRVDAALAVAKANADEAASLSPGWVGGLWGSIIGASSTVTAAREDARQTIAAYERLAAQAAAWSDPTSPIVENIELSAFERSCGEDTNVTTLRETAQRLSLVTAARETLAPKGGPGFWPPSAWPAWLKVAIVAVGVLLLVPLFAPLIASGLRRRE